MEHDAVFNEEEGITCGFYGPSEFHLLIVSVLPFHVDGLIVDRVQRAADASKSAYIASRPSQMATIALQQAETSQTTQHVASYGVRALHLANMSLRMVANRDLSVDKFQRDANEALCSGSLLLLRQFLLSSANEIDENDLILQKWQTIEAWNTYDFVLENDQYRSWLQSPTSSMLGITGPAGSGKTAISALIYREIMKMSMAKDWTPTVFLNCGPKCKHTASSILLALIWDIVRKRPDTLSGVGGVEELIKRISQADTLESLFTILCRLIQSLAQVWVVLDSVHDSESDTEKLLDKFAELVRERTPKVQVKVLVTSREKFILGKSFGPVLTYTHKDMEQGVMKYVKKKLGRLSKCKPEGPRANDLVADAVEATNRLGGGLFLARVIMSRLQGQRSLRAAQRYLCNLHKIEQIESSLLSNITREPEVARVIIAALIAILRNTRPLATFELRDQLIKDQIITESVSVTELYSCLYSRVKGFVYCVNGYFVIPTRAIKPLSLDFLSRLIRKQSS
ncbi:hypothetical protein F5Y06DRAFT_300525 [Hypoxylon sp. FL0890]|nr:hypothetical protein F5Y06DRAFT_300525 [Hypoxylon sp. FL0890]